MGDILNINTLDLCFKDCAHFTLEARLTLIVHKISWDGSMTEVKHDQFGIHRILSILANSFSDFKSLNVNLRESYFENREIEESHNSC